MEEKTNGTNIKNEAPQENRAYGDAPRFVKKPRPQDRRKTEIQNFLLCDGEELPTLFPAPVGYDVPKFQRAIGMAEGVILEANKKGNGFIEIDGIKYPMKENRTGAIQKRFPLEKYVGKTVKVSFYPTITLKGMKMLKMNATDTPFIKIANFRKEVTKQGGVEVLGTIKFINPDNFVVAIWSPSAKKEYIVTLFGKCSAKQGEFVKIDALLKDGKLEVENTKILNVPARTFAPRENTGGYNRDNRSSGGGYNRDYNSSSTGGYNRDNNNSAGGGYNSGYKSDYRQPPREDVDYNKKDA
ncbi:MAG: hypothetical protein AABZ74_06250 [Cyanobacteriota bacterium]